MAPDEQIFETIAETPYDELTTETIQEWINTSEKYYTHNDLEVQEGVHGNDECTDATDNCCTICGHGHLIVTKTTQRNGQPIVSMLACTHPSCPGPIL